MTLYLHELVDTVPGRTEDYLDSMCEHHARAAAAAGRTDAMLGLFTAVEATGAWPLAVNVWRTGDWPDAAAALERQFEPRAQDPTLKAWWLRNTSLRTGGFDRLVESTPYTRDVARLRADGVQGALFLHEIVRCEPGRVEEYLDALGDDGASAFETAGGELVGSYRVRMRDHEAIVLVAFREPADLGRFQKSWHGAGSRLRSWREREDRWVRGKDASILRPRYFLTSPWHI
jgi:hypothetical protein